MKVLVVGDGYMPAEVFQRSFQALDDTHDIRYADVDETRVLPVSAQALPIREYIGHPDQLVELIDGDDALVVHGAPVTDAVLAASPNLTVVMCARGGPVNVDVDAATRRGVAVTTTPGKNADAVADLTVAFLVMLARRLPTAQRFLLEGGQLGASAFEGREFFGHDLGGHTLGLVGYGQVGRRVAARVHPFGVKVLVHDPYLDGSSTNGAVIAVTLEELLGASDFVSVHARANAATSDMFDAAAFAAMKPGAWFVNTARETLVDEAALEAALRSGHLAGAALDVLRPVPGGGRHPLLDLDQVIVTPHIGGATDETLARGAAMLGEELERLAAGDAMRNVLNEGALEAG